METFKNSPKPVYSTSHLTNLTREDKQKQSVQGQRAVFTHFVSLPLATYPELKEKLNEFQNSILVNNNENKSLADMGIDKSMFASPNTFHLTVVMLTLRNKESVDAAQDLLRSISSDVRQALGNRPVFIRLKGLDCMTGSLDKTHVLYAPVEEVGHEGRLLSACHVIIDAFVNAGFAVEGAKSRLKLHTTMMNAGYRRDRDKRRDPFDASVIHKVFGDKDWGEYLIREAHISQRYTYEPTSGYFHCCASLPFPLE